MTSIDKQNVLATSKLWRKVAEEVALEFPDVTLEHQLVDSAAMIMITNPSRFDVVVTENLLVIFCLMNQACFQAHLVLCHQLAIQKMDQAFIEPDSRFSSRYAGQGIVQSCQHDLSVAMIVA